jgi:hypothetical protein
VTSLAETSQKSQALILQKLNIALRIPAFVDGCPQAYSLSAIDGAKLGVT